MTCASSNIKLPPHMRRYTVTYKYMYERVTSTKDANNTPGHSLQVRQRANKASHRDIKQFKYKTTIIIIIQPLLLCLNPWNPILKAHQF